MGINTTGVAPDGSALLDLSATDKGFLITRVDTANIISPAFGLMTLSPVDSCLYLFNGIKWMDIGGGGSDCSCNCESSGDISPTSCGSPFTDARDNITYGTVEIRNQCWMKENLNFETTSGSWCFDNDPVNCIIYGRLYDWNTATNNVSSNTNPSGVQGVCPVSWHIPSDEEWKELEIFLGMSQTEADNTGWRGTNEAAALKYSGWGGNNSSGFTALRGGHRHPINWII